MGSKNITITDEAYEFLKSMQDDDKSFSDVIFVDESQKNRCDGLRRGFEAR